MNPIAKLIVDKGIGLAESQIPKIMEMAKAAGIDMVKGQLPDKCKLMLELQKMLELRNQIMNQINTVSNSINSLNKTTDTIQPAIDTTKSSLQIATAARIAAKAVIKAIPSPPGTPGIVISVIDDLKDLEEYLKPIITTNINKINSITTAVNFANSILLKMKNLLSMIDEYLTGCGIDPNSLTPLNNSLQQLQLQNNLSNNTYKEFILEIVEEPYSPTVNRRKAVAKNTQGIILLSTPLTFSTENQVLIQEIKLIIDSNNLKAD